MRRTHDFDAKDREILALLEEDARRPTSEIARMTGLSPPTVSERIARLRDIGVIRGFTTRLDPARLGLAVSAAIEFRPTGMNDDEAAIWLARFPEIRDCFRVTGTACFILMVRVPSNDALRALIETLYKHGETRTSLILATDFEDRPFFGGG